MERCSNSDLHAGTVAHIEPHASSLAPIRTLWGVHTHPNGFGVGRVGQRNKTLFTEVIECAEVNKAIEW